ncbi:hypothetical protein TNCV_3325381 [Trichonephila clavipes]|nr:hypothetical protein TNCV_3325381 [Trichonephila clavipes]
MIARIVQSEEGHGGTNNVASIDYYLLPDIQCHQEKTILGLRSRRPLRRLPLTPHHRQCRLDFFSVTDWRRVSSSVSVLMTTAHVSGGASGPIRHLLSIGIQQFHKV